MKRSFEARCTVALICALLALGGRAAAQQSATYSMDYSEQNFGASIGESTNYVVDDAIDFAATEKTGQTSVNYSVQPTLDFRRGANNGLGAGFGSTMRLSWPDSGLEAIQGYDLFRASSPGGPYNKINNAPVQGTQYDDENLANGTYYYLIYIVDGDGSRYEWTYIVGTIEGVMNEVWVDFAWQGDQSGSISAPFRMLGSAVSWVAHGGAIRLKAGSSNETVRITKPVRLTCETPGLSARIGADD